MADSVSSRKARSKRKRSKNAKINPIVVSAPSPAQARVPPATSTMNETMEETLFWYNGGSDEKSQNMAALKLEVLGPFLFSRNSLCKEATSMARHTEFLSSDSAVWPVFFHMSKWNQITQMVRIMLALVGLCDKDQNTYESLLSGAPVDSVEKIRDHCPGGKLKDVTDDQIRIFFDVIKLQGLSFGQRDTENNNLAGIFFRSLTDKVKLVDPVKDRGNSNFKQLRFKAAIADYSTAIKLCPFSPVLYCNRALCYLRNEDFWNACVDSYRALVLHPTWEKPYYRCAEALHRLGEIVYAVEVNELGQVLSTTTSELHSQLNSFISAKAKNIALQEQEVVGSKQEVVESTGDEKTGGKERVEDTAAAKEKVRTAAAKEKLPAKSKLSSSRTEYTDFEKLQCPDIDPRISCSELRKLCNRVKLEWCSPASYLGHHCQWEELEPEWLVPTPPSTDPLAEREPMMAKFEEIWCPLLADVEESLSIIPPTFQYFSDGTVMHSTYN